MAAYLTFQWLQVSALVWLADIYNIDLANSRAIELGGGVPAVPIFPTSGMSVLFGLTAIAAIWLGFRLSWPASRMAGQLNVWYRPSLLLAAYLSLLLVHLVSGPFIGGGFAQPLIALGALRLMFAALLVYHWILRRENGLYLAVVVPLELLVGFSGYFSEFKQIFVVLAVALLTLAPVQWKRVSPLLAGSVAVALVLGIVWTGIKGTYRDQLSGGQATQAVTLSIGKRFEALQSLVLATSSEDLRNSAGSFVSRIMYTEYLARVMERVPAVQPHAAGEIWGAALTNAMVPRLLFPDKPSLASDSDLTMRYTGLRLASDAQGTVITIGYAGDAYIDFGIFGAVILFFGLGILYGLTSRSVASCFDRTEAAAASAALIVLLSGCGLFESSSVKLFAGYLWMFIIVYLFGLGWRNFKEFFVEPKSTDTHRRESRGGTPLLRERHD
jgi:hypothetical protein